MPVFNLELRFDNNGALQAVNQINRITRSSDDATRSIRNMGDESGRSGEELSRMGRIGEQVTSGLTAAMKRAAKEALGLVAAYTAVSKAMGFLNRGVEFYASLEQSQIGIASLITSMVKLQDAQGQVLEGAEKYASAQDMAAELMEKIQVLGLRTTADSKSIIEGFQSILAPALEAGIALENIPEFAVNAAQAMQTLGIPLNQMRTELDALLTGSVNLSQDILAPKLFADVKGNLKEYIQGLREAGTLEVELTKRLEPFKLALKDTETTWAAISSNLEEALDKLAGDSALNYTKAMKESLKQVNDLIIDTDTGKISKDFENIAKLLAEIEDWLGNKILASAQTLVGFTKDINAFLGTDLGQGALGAFTTALKLAAGALAGFAAARIAAFSNDKIINPLRNSMSALSQYRNRIVEVANTQLEAAIAERNRQQAFMATQRAQQAAAASARIREAQLAREAMLINQVAAAQRNLAQAVSASSLGGMAATGLSKFVTLLGGPLNTGLMAAGVAFTALSMKQTEAERATEAHRVAQEKFTETIGKVISVTGELTRALTDVEQVEARAALRLLEQDFEAQITAMEAVARQYDVIGMASAGWGVMLSEEDEATKKAANSFRELVEELKSGAVDADTFKIRLEEIYNTLNAAVPDNSSLGKYFDELLRSKDLTEVISNLQKTKEALENTTKAAEGGISVIQEQASIYGELKKALDDVDTAQKAQVDTIDGAIKYISKYNDGTEEGKKRQQEMAKAVYENAIATLKLKAAILEAEVATEVFNSYTGQATDAQINQANAKIQALTTLQNLIEVSEKNLATFGQDTAKKTGGGGGRKRSSGGGGGGSKTDPAEAAKKWEELNDKLAELQGTATGAESSLKKTLSEIAKTGAEAKKSAQEIEALQEAFQKATDIKNIKELNKELLQLEGNTRAVEQIENQEKTDQFRARLSEIKSLSEDEKNILLGRYEQAIQTNIKVDDLKSAIDFMQELEGLGSHYGITLQMQNELIEYQAQLYREKLPSDMQPYIDQWERLKLLGNDTSFMAGLERGVRKFGQDYTDLATTVENFTTQMGSTIGNTLSDAFMKGKLSAEDFFSSLISMAAQAASNYFIGMIFKGIGEKFSSSPASSVSRADTVAFYGGAAQGAVFSGGNIGTFSGRVVSGPTLFNYNSQLTPFARGAGVMGEAGAEAIMPLTRMKNGDLGVQVKVDYDNNWQQVTANYAKLIADLQAQMRSDQQYANNAPMVNINISNQVPNADVQAGQMQPDGNGGFNLEIVVAQIEQRLVGRMKQGKSQLAQYQEQTYGMSRAGVIARGRGRN